MGSTDDLTDDRSNRLIMYTPFKGEKGYVQFNNSVKNNGIVVLYSSISYAAFLKYFNVERSRAVSKAKFS